MLTGKLLGEILIEESFLERTTLDKALEHQKVNILPLGQILIDMQAITEEELNRALGQKFGSIYLNPNKYRMNDKDMLLRLVPAEYAKKYHCFPLEVSKDTLTIAIDNPFYTEALARLSALTKLKIKFVHSPINCINGLIDKYYTSFTNNEFVSINTF